MSKVSQAQLNSTIISQHKRILENGSIADKIQTLERLWHFSFNASAHVPTLINSLLYDEAPEMRWRAIEVLRSVDSYSKNVLEALRIALTDEDYYVRWHARGVLRNLSLREKTILWLTEALSNKDPHVRADMAEELRLLNADSNKSTRALVKVMQFDDNPQARVEASLALNNVKDGDDFIIEAARKSLSDVTLAVRLNAAMILKNKDLISQSVIDVFVDSVEDKLLASQALGCIIDIATSQENGVASFIRGKPVKILRQLCDEAIARGILPTIGLKVWHKHLPIEIPTHKDKIIGDYPYVWEDEGVFHSWRSHGRWSKEFYPLTIHQVCIHSDWFKGIHLIAISQLVLFFKNDINLAVAPAYIEGKGVGLIAQTGGTLLHLEKMRSLATPYRTDRIDFLFGFWKDARILQYLMFSGISANMLQEERDIFENRAAVCWGEFCEGLTRILSENGLLELAVTEWYQEDGQSSIRYGIRFERSYSEIRPLLLKLVKVLKSSEGSSIRNEVAKLVYAIVDMLEVTLLKYRMERLPSTLQKFFNGYYSKT